MKNITEVLNNASIDTKQKIKQHSGATLTQAVIDLKTIQKAQLELKEMEATKDLLIKVLLKFFR